ncbi:MAG: FHA domain-containing protein, partial [Planctomycetota bacterium]
MARLFVLSGRSIGSTFDVEGTSVLGRGDEADVQLKETSISRSHARLVPQPEPGTWKVVDLDSSNGLHVGGRRVRDAVLRDGDTFLLGDVELR